MTDLTVISILSYICNLFESKPSFYHISMRLLRILVLILSPFLSLANFVILHCYLWRRLVLLVHCFCRHHSLIHSLTHGNYRKSVLFSDRDWKIVFLPQPQLHDRTPHTTNAMTMGFDEYLIAPNFRQRGNEEKEEEGLSDTRIKLS
jgi:hypothetical protein